MNTNPPIPDIAHRIATAFHPRRIILFGSRARGTNRPDSDVDLMVEMDSDLDPLDRMRAVQHLFRGRLWAMDVVVYTPTEISEQRQYRNSLLTAIERDGVVLYEQ